MRIFTLGLALVLTLTQGAAVHASPGYVELDKKQIFLGFYSRSLQKALVGVLDDSTGVARFLECHAPHGASLSDLTQCTALDKGAYLANEETVARINQAFPGALQKNYQSLREERLRGVFSDDTQLMAFTSFISAATLYTLHHMIVPREVYSGYRPSTRVGYFLVLSVGVAVITSAVVYTYKQIKRDEAIPAVEDLGQKPMTPEESSATYDLVKQSILDAILDAHTI